MSAWSPFFISFLNGLLVLRVILKNKQESDGFLFLFLAVGFGLGLSGALTFFSFVLLNELNKSFVICLHSLIFLLSLMLLWARHKKDKEIFFCRNLSFDKKDILSFVLLLAAFIPAVYYARATPLGGWDAWSVWNLKAKFLFLSGPSWQNIFSPLLWRSSPHYPLLLPLINVWAWTFSETSNAQAPMITALLFSFATAGVLFGALRLFVKKEFALLVSITLITLPFFFQSGTRQYSDIVIANFLLSAAACFTMGFLKDRNDFLVLCGMFLGFLSFTKPEGLIGAFLFLSIAVFLYILKKEKQPTGYLFLGLGITALPAVIFYGFMAPKNLTFINGLSAQAHPSNFLRLKTIVAFLFVELTNHRWHGLWLLVIAGILLRRDKAFAMEIVFLPSFLAGYAIIICAYYFINTYFPISWWLSASLNRLLFSVLPMTLFYASLMIFAPKEKSKTD